MSRYLVTATRGSLSVSQIVSDRGEAARLTTCLENDRFADVRFLALPDDRPLPSPTFAELPDEPLEAGP